MADKIKFKQKQRPSIIKVLGVGGGGCNAVNHMFEQGIEGVDFVVCNTDVQSLNTSPVPTKIEIGNNGGLGAGANPDVGRKAAEDSIEKVKELLSSDKTEMLFVTAGMGGGTGTGAAPIIAKLAREMNILTVGIVTLPFGFEGRKRKQQAEFGIEEMKKHVDTLLVISNDKLREQFGNLVLKQAFAQADNILSSAAKGIAELITVPGYVNVDFEDVRTVIKDSGKAIMGSARAEGEGRAEKAITAAMNSPLLNDNEINGATNILLYITIGEKDITFDEITEITDYVQKESGNTADTIWGVGNDESLGESIGITIIATGFDVVNKEPEPDSIVVGTVGEENQPETKTPPPKPSVSDSSNVAENAEIKKIKKETVRAFNSGKGESKVVHAQDGIEDKHRDQSVPVAKQRMDPSSLIRRTENPYLSVAHTVSAQSSEQKTETVQQPATEKDDAKKTHADRESKLRNQSIDLSSHEKLAEYENEPAYVRKNIMIDNANHSSESVISRYALSKDSKNQPVINDNKFIHDNVD